MSSLPLDRRLVAVASAALLFACGGGTTPRPAECEAIVDRCHALDPGSGPIHDCHESAESTWSQAECVANAAICQAVCVATDSDAGAEPDSGTAPDAGPPDSGVGGGVTCGATTCARGEVCCAATGPGGDTCSLPAACARIRCTHSGECTGGQLCCTDGINSVCEDAASCFERACRTAMDCDGSESCCPFGAMQRACRPSC
jgi:hypothetical protein